ncbi:MAG: replication initiation protein [Colwellia sp.]
MAKASHEVATQLELPVVESRSGNYQVVKSNKLIESQYTLKATHLKLLSAIIGYVDPTKDYSKNGENPFFSLTLHRDDVTRRLGISRSNVYKVLDEATDAFMGLKAEFKEKDAKTGNESFRKIGLINDTTFDGTNFYISFTTAATKELYDLAGVGYTKYVLGNIVNLMSKYSIRLYEVIHKVMPPSTSKYICRFELSDLQYFLGCRDSSGDLLVKTAKSYSEFKRHILMPSIKELNKKTNIDVEICAEKRTGRFITTLEFVVQRVNGASEGISRLIKLGVKPAQANDWCVEYGDDDITRNIEFMDKQIAGGKEINSIPGYLDYLLKFDVAGLPDVANPYSHLYSNDPAAQTFVKSFLMPNWFSFNEPMRKAIVEEGIFGSITGQHFKEFKSSFIENSVNTTGLVDRLKPEINSLLELEVVE